MTNCRLILCEKNPHFAPAVRRELTGNSIQMIETRGLAACEAALAESPESLVAIETTVANLEAVVDFVLNLGSRYPRARAVALLNTDMAAAETLLAEAGAIAVFHSLLDAPALARLAERKAGGVSPEDLSLQEFVAERLPWPAYAGH
jgi:hypothetical protein